MSVRVEKRWKTFIPFNIEKTTQKLLARVPQEHLVGLDAVIIVDQVTDKRKEKSVGLYWQKEARQPAKIEIAATALYKGMPRIFFYLPFVAKFMLADVLFHEIGHHYRHFTHGEPKEEREDFAEKYKKEMLRKTFFWWRVFLLPLAPLVRWLNRLVNKERSTRWSKIS